MLSDGQETRIRILGKIEALLAAKCEGYWTAQPLVISTQPGIIQTGTSFMKSCSTINHVAQPDILV